MVMYEYMVAYAYPEGLGRSVFSCDKPIDSGTRIDEVESWLREKNGYGTVSIMNLQLLREYDHTGEV